MNVQSIMECQQLVHLITISWLVVDVDYEYRSGTLAIRGRCAVPRACHGKVRCSRFALFIG